VCQKFTLNVCNNFGGIAIKVENSKADTFFFLGGGGNKAGRQKSGELKKWGTPGILILLASPDGLELGPALYRITIL
jgi:hypothetical protein